MRYKLALLSNAEIRDNGTFCLIRDTLWRRMGLRKEDVPWYMRGHPLPEDVEADLWLFVDDGRDDLPMQIPKPAACYLIDTHLGWDIRRQWASHFDYVFCAQKFSAEQMRQEGLNAFWLPLACHPPAQPNLAEMQVHPKRDDIVGKKGLAKVHDVAFVGFLNDRTGEGFNNRVDYLDRLLKAYPPPKGWMSFNCFHEDAAVRYIRSKIGFNISIRNDLNMRFFEIPSYGTAMLTNRDVVGWQELGFVEGVHFIGYQGPEEMLEKAAYYVEHEKEREDIARQGHELVRGAHTYKHRLEEMFKVIGVGP